MISFCELQELNTRYIFIILKKSVYQIGEHMIYLQIMVEDINYFLL